MATQTVILTESLISNKSQILRNHLHILWHHQNALLLLCTRIRFPQFPFLLLPHNLHLLPHHFPIRHHHLRSPPSLPPLLRPRSSPMSSLAPPDSSSVNKTVKVVIKGRVQGVFYRDWTVENATELGLKGWVRNRRDGSVEALFSGSAEKVDEMQERCRRGPPSAVVTGLAVNPSVEDPGTGFERRSSV